MRPLKVEFQAFGSYRGYESVDFTDLASNGLFLICGKTGTGKTTILDAITFALYGMSSGGGRNDFEQMRCKNADPKTSTFVKFEFENKGRIYRFERTIELKIKNFNATYSILEKNDADIFVPISNNLKKDEMTKKAEEIIGLKYEQFIQVIVLPQGKFERLLVSNSDEKAEILKSIFGEEQWSKIADKILEQARERRKKISDIIDACTASLSEEGCLNIDELRDVITSLKNESADLENEFQKTDYNALIKENQEKLTFIKQFEELDKEEALSRELEDKKAFRSELSNKVTNATKANKVKPYLDNIELQNKTYEARKKEQALAESNLITAKEEFEKAKSRLDKQLFMAGQIEEIKAQKIKYENKISDYEQVDIILEQLGKSKELEKVAQALEEQAKKKSNQIGESIVSLSKEYDALVCEHSSMLKSYLAGIKGELARELVDGEECPVCGSKTHPHKAVYTDTDITKEQVDLKNSEKDEKYSELMKARELKDEADADFKDKHAATEEAKQKVIEASTRYDEIKKNLDDEIDSLEKLNEVINECEKQVNDYLNKKTELENKLKVLSDAYTEASAKIDVAIDEVNVAFDKLEIAEKELKDCLEGTGYSSLDEAKEQILSEEQIIDCTRKISEYDAAVSMNAERLCKLKEELAKIERPDRTSCQRAIDEASEAKDAYTKKKAEYDTKLTRLTEKEAKLSKQLNGIVEKLADADADLKMAKSIRGESGVGLQRYVYGILFSSVIAAANQMLEHFDNGRYRLYRTDDKSGGSKKAGLELKVIDKYSNDPNGNSRFVGTLSGGEKFLASLALSIGMSTIAGRGGINIEAMFIDEGFGSLDEDCIDDAMDILNSVQQANGVVGIISHVKLLRDRIPTKLMVTGGRDGSHIVHTVG